MLLEQKAKERRRRMDALELEGLRMEVENSMTNLVETVEKTATMTRMRRKKKRKSLMAVMAPTKKVRLKMLAENQQERNEVEHAG